MASPASAASSCEVCNDCNGWMNQKLEIPARKTLEALHHSNSIVLRADDQALLAAYMTKHMLMINLWSQAPTDPTFDTRMYRRFRVTMEPPAYTRIWVGVIKDADTEREQQVTGVLPETRDLGDGVEASCSREAAAVISPPSMNCSSCGRESLDVMVAALLSGNQSRVPG